MPKSNSSPRSDRLNEESKNDGRISIPDLVLSLTEPFPIQVDFKLQIEQFLNSGVLKPIEHPRLRENLELSLRNERIPKLCFIALEIILVTKYPFTLKTPALIPLLKQKLSKNYVKLFAELPQPKDEIMNFIIFVCAYNIHWMLWKIAVEQREEMDLRRFVFDCYHILIFSLNGIFVSDSYIRIQIEKIFSSKFMEYERERKEKMIMRKLEQKKKANQKTFLGQRLEFPSLNGVDGGSEFARVLNDKFRIKRGGSYAKDDESQAKGEHGKFNLHQTVTQPQNLTNVKATQENEDLQYQNFKQEGKQLLQNLQLNVNQVSPSVCHVLQMNRMQLPFSRKKMLSHTFEKNDEKTDGILHLLKEMTNQRKQKKDTKTSKKHTKNLIEVYDLRAPGKEFFQKNHRVDTLFKDMLELNYVLQYHQESLDELYSTKELHKNLEENPEEMQQVLDINSLNPQKRIQAYLQNKIKIHQQQDQQEESKIQIHNQGKLSMALPSIQEKSPETEGRVRQQYQSTLITNIKTNEDEKLKTLQHNNQLQNLKRSTTVKNIKQKKEEEPLYQIKTNAYKTKYDHILSGESTDSKISDLVHNIQGITKSLKKK